MTGWPSPTEFMMGPWHGFCCANVGAHMMVSTAGCRWPPECPADAWRARRDLRHGVPDVAAASACRQHE